MLRDRAADDALARARWLARSRGASLHVLEATHLRSPSEAVLAIADTVEDERAALVVLGRDASRASAAAFADEVHRSTEAPVLFVRNAAFSPYDDVVCAVDDGSDVRAMAAAADSVAPTASVEWLHAFDTPHEVIIAHGVGLVHLRHHRNDAELAARERIHELLTQARLEEPRLRLEHGPASAVLLRVRPRALLVVHRGRSWLKRALFGSVTRSVLAGAGPDVLVV